MLVLASLKDTDITLHLQAYMDSVLVFRGTAFLVNIIAITELVLIAVALDIILNIIDFLFAVLAASQDQHVIHRLDEPPLKPWPHKKGPEERECTTVVLVPLG